MNNNKQNNVENKVYRTDDCFTCPDQKKCATESKRKIKNRCESEINEIKKKFITPNGVKKFIMEDVPMQKAILEHYLNLETSEE